MKDRILVTFASRAGSTAGVAEEIGKRLSKKGAEVDVLPMNEVKTLDGYYAVVAGSAIRGAKWLPEAMRFIQAQQVELAKKRCAVFSVCITLAMKNGENYRAGIKDWTQPARDIVRPISEGMFAGHLDFSNMPNDFDAIKMRLAVKTGIFPAGDHRDWNAIGVWADNLYPILTR